MQISSINLLMASWLFLCFISPLQSDPQRSYGTNPDVYNYPERRFYPVKPVNDPRYIGTSIPKPPVKEHYNYQQINPQVRWTPNRQIYNQNYPREGLNNYEAKHVPRRFDEEIYYNYNYEGAADQNDDNLGTATPSYQQLDIEDENDVDEEAILEKMQILDRVLSEDSINKDLDSNTIEEKIIFESIPEETKRVARQIRNKRPGFFWTLARVTFETYNDTKSAIQQISNIIGNNISPDSATQRTTTLLPPTTPSTTSLPDQNKMSSNLANANTTPEVTTMATTTTTEEETYVLTRGGLQSLIRRNVLGLIRLFNVEWKEAINESEASVREFQKNLGNQIGVYLQDNPNVF